MLISPPSLDYPCPTVHQMQLWQERWEFDWVSRKFWRISVKASVCSDEVD